jgi:GT2 family glycosyltransferase
MTNKVDVAIQSYKKPESLIYTLLSLKQACGHLIDTIYINDDCSNDGTMAYYIDPHLHECLAPIQLKLRVNKKPGGWGTQLMTKRFKPKSFKSWRRFVYAYLKNALFEEADIRYQWAIMETDKKYLFVIHDDIKFTKNILKLYYDTIESDSNYAIVGDLGQCWICKDSMICHPTKIVEGTRPHAYWPLTTSDKGSFPKYYERACRINEWCCLINVKTAKKIAKQHACYFGNHEDGGDTAAYWFDKIMKLGYAFTDPLPSQDLRDHYYQHCWQGHSGHSVWEEQAGIKNVYQKEKIRLCLKEEFGYEFSDR